MDKLYSDIMNIPCTRTMSHFASQHEMMAYKEGHRDARHAACDLVVEYNAQARTARPEGAADSPHTSADTNVSGPTASASIDTPEFMDLLCEFYEQASCEEFDPPAYDTARKAIVDYIDSRATLAPIASTYVSAPASQVAAQQAAAKAQGARQSVNPAAQAVPGDWTVEWESVSSPTMIRLNSPTWGGCFLPKPPPGDIALASIFYYLLADMLAATPASTPEASQQAAAVAAPSAKVIINDGNGTATVMLAPGVKLPVGASLYLAAPTAAAATTSDDARDAARYHFIEEHATMHGGGHGFTITCFVGADEEDMGVGIDRAMRATQQEGE